MATCAVPWPMKTKAVPASLAASRLSKPASADGSGGDGLGDSFLVGVDDGGVGADLAEHRLCDGDGFKLDRLYASMASHISSYSAPCIRCVGWTTRFLTPLATARSSAWVHVVDLLAVTGLDVVDDDLRGEGAADGPVGVRGLQGVFDALDVGHAAVVEGRAEGDDQQLVFADLVLVAGVILARRRRCRGRSTRGWLPRPRRAPSARRSARPTRPWPLRTARRCHRCAPARRWRR